MDKVPQFESIRPRLLRYRSHYKIYLLAYLMVSLVVLTYWGLRFAQDGFPFVVKQQSAELMISGIYFLLTGCLYVFWLRMRLHRSVQVFSDHLLVVTEKRKEEVYFNEIESLNVVCWSIFYVKMKSGIKYYFNSSLERVDYIWEGIYAARSDLTSQVEFEDYRLKLVQYDHHQKRKEWFFKHKMVDVFNWLGLPTLFLLAAYFFQSKDVEIHQAGLYFFRLIMFSFLVILCSTFVYSIVLKKLVFDKKLAAQFEHSVDKMRDLEFEGMILQRSKLFQFITSCFVLAMIVRLDVNFYSVTKVKEDLTAFNLKKGHSFLVDNRYNCVECRYQLKDGDIVLFGRGLVGQVMAKGGDMVGQVSQDRTGRTIASENVQIVPAGHVALKASNGKDIMFIPVAELIGKIQK